MASVEAWPLAEAMPARRRGGIEDQAGPAVAAAAQSPSPVRDAAAAGPRDGQRMVEPAVLPAAAAMEPRQAAIGMPQRPQRRRDPLDRRQMRAVGHLPGLGKRRRGPVEQGEDFQQFLGVAGRHPAFDIDGRGAFLAPATSSPARHAAPSPPAPARRRSARSAPRTAAGPARRRASGGPERSSAGRANGRTGRAGRSGAAFSRNSAWLIQRIIRRPVRSGVQPGPWPPPQRSSQSASQACASCRARASPTAARSSSQANPCASAMNSGDGAAISKSDTSPRFSTS